MRIAFTFLICFCFTILQAQEVSLSFDRKQILIGEQIEVKLFTAIDNSTPFEPIDTLPHFEILERSKIDTVKSNNGSMILSQSLLITSWDSGSWNLPTVISNGNATKPVLIEVGYTKPWDSRKPYNDIKGIKQVKAPGKDTWWWYVIGGAVLVALFLLFFPEGKQDASAVKIDSNAYKKAMQQLEALQKKPDFDAKQYYTELILIFRTYLKGAKGIQSFSKTTDDISIQLQQLKLKPADYTELVQTLRLSDLVKFARYKPEQKATDESFQTIKQSIALIDGRYAV